MLSRDGDGGGVSAMDGNSLRSVGAGDPGGAQEEGGRSKVKALEEHWESPSWRAPMVEAALSEKVSRLGSSEAAVGEGSGGRGR